MLIDQCFATSVRYIKKRLNVLVEFCSIRWRQKTQNTRDECSDSSPAVWYSSRSLCQSLSHEHLSGRGAFQCLAAYQSLHSPHQRRCIRLVCHSFPSSLLEATGEKTIFSIKFSYKVLSVLLF